MQGLVERARQALNIGSGGDAFLPSSLDAAQQSLDELRLARAPLQRLAQATAAFEADTRAFLQAAGALATKAPSPQAWVQADATTAPVPTPIPVPEGVAAWFDPTIAAREASTVPDAVSFAFTHELLAPLQQWLLAHEVAEGRMTELRSKRLAYDAERRALVSRASKAVDVNDEGQQPPPAAAAGAAGGGSQAGGLMQLTEDAAAAKASLALFEADAEALQDLLEWLAAGVARVKALAADAAGGVAAGAGAWAPPPGLMPPFPDKSVIAEDLKVTVELTDAPTAAADTSASGGGGISSSSAQPEPPAAGAGSTEPPQPRQPLVLTPVLPSEDALVEGAGQGGGATKPASPGTTRPSGGDSTAKLLRVRSAAAAPHEQQPAVPGLHKTASHASAPADSSSEAVPAASANAPAAPASARPQDTSGGDDGAVDTFVGSSAAPPPAAGGSTEAGGGLLAAVTHTISEAADTLAAQVARRAGGAAAGDDDAAVVEEEEEAAASCGAGASGVPVFAKAATVPGGAAASEQEPSPPAAGGSELVAVLQGGMHIGPVVPQPGSAVGPDPEPGSAVWIKGATPPGAQLQQTRLPAPLRTSTEA